MKSKLEREFQADEDDTVVVPKEDLPPMEITPTALKKTVKREMSDKQRENMLKLIEANKKKWAEKRDAKVKAMEQSAIDEAKAKKLADEEKINAGTHVRVKLKEKVQYKPRESPKEAPKTVEKPKKPSRKPVYSSESDTATEYSTDSESDERLFDNRRRVGAHSYDEEPVRHKVHKEVKRNVKALERIDGALQKTQQSANPYMTKLMSSWK